MAARACVAWAMALTVLLCILEEAAGRGKGISGEGAAIAAFSPALTASESFLAGVRDWCPRIGGSVPDLAGVAEGEEAALQQALNIVQEKKDYVALLFYASWCPFSRACRPNFSALSLLFPSIRHFAFEEAAIRPSILSRYGVYGFPTLFLINSTMRIRYHGSRDVASLVAFYNDVTGIPLRPLDSAAWERVHPPPESCPFSWARSPERLLKEDTWLALAAAFVACRVVFLLAPAVLGCGRRAWRRHGGSVRLMSVWDESRGYVERGRLALRKLSRRRDLQEGARMWAPQSLVPVKMGEPGSVRGVRAGFQRT